MAYVFEGLQPQALWRYFYELNQIPRESKHEQAVGQWVIGVARKLGLSYKQDKAGSIVISKPATSGAEHLTGVVLQGHLDMVCEKNKDTVHDFRNDPIDMVVDGDFVRARGTTLGADNGIGVAAALAVLEDRTLVHPPVEALFTIDEETGLTGANALEPGFVNGRILLNGDSEEDGALYVGCAGGKDTEMFFDAEWESSPAGMRNVLIKLTGLKGGHSGLDIHTGRANAIKQVARLLWNLDEALDVRLYYIEGGSKHNAIPRETEAKLLVSQADYSELEAMVARHEAVLRAEYQVTEPGIRLSVVPENDYPERVFTKSFQNRLAGFLFTVPHGVQAMSQAIEGLVETSTNMAIVRTEADRVSALTSQRSSVATEITEIAEKVKALGLLTGAQVRQGTGYPAWTPNMDSKILRFMRETYHDLYGRFPEVKAIHAGLECGIIGEKYPGMDMISFGPTIHGAHSPDERVQISTVARFWDLLIEVLRRLAR